MLSAFWLLGLLSSCMAYRHLLLFMRDNRSMSLLGITTNSKTTRFFKGAQEKKGMKTFFSVEESEYK